MFYLQRVPSTTLQLSAGIIFMHFVAYLAASKNNESLIALSVVALLLLILALILNLLLAQGHLVLRGLVAFGLLLLFGIHVFLWLDFLKSVD